MKWHTCCCQSPWFCTIAAFSSYQVSERSLTQDNILILAGTQSLCRCQCLGFGLCYTHMHAHTCTHHLDLLSLWPFTLFCSPSQHLLHLTWYTLWFVLCCLLAHSRPSVTIIHANEKWEQPSREEQRREVVPAGSGEEQRAADFLFFPLQRQYCLQIRYSDSHVTYPVQILALLLISRWPWANHWLTLSFSSLVSEMGVIISTMGLVVKVKGDVAVTCSVQCPRLSTQWLLGNIRTMAPPLLFLSHRLLWNLSLDYCMKVWIQAQGRQLSGGPSMAPGEKPPLIMCNPSAPAWAFTQTQFTTLLPQRAR